MALTDDQKLEQAGFSKQEIATNTLISAGFTDSEISAHLATMEPDMNGVKPIFDSNFEKHGKVKKKLKLKN